MAFVAVPISIGLGTIISLLVAAGKGGIDAASITIDGVDGVKSAQSKVLVERCTEIIEDLQQMDHHLLITGRTHRLVSTIVDALAWASEYDSKWLIKKIFLNRKYQRVFKKKHQEITKYFHDLVLSVLLTGLFPDKLSLTISQHAKKISGLEKSDNNMEDDILHMHEILDRHKYSIEDDKHYDVIM